MHASTFGNVHSVTLWSRQDRVSVAFSAPTARRNVRRGNGKRALPNMRLKLAGRSLLRESEWLCPGGHRTSSTANCASELAARSLSAIR